MFHPAAALHAKALSETLLEDARRLPAALAEVRTGGQAEG
jgi:hypothetical protein